MDIHLSILGPLRLEVDDQPVTITADRDRTVLAALVLTPGRPVSPHRLIEAVWGNHPPRRARNQIQGCVSRLRRRLPCAERVIVTEPAGYRLNVTDDSVDVTRFRRLRLAGQREAAADPATAARIYRAALACWRGDAFMDIDSGLIARAAVALNEERLQTVEACLAAELAAGGGSALVPPLTQLVQDHPYRERLHGLLMLALYRSGRPTEAIASYQQLQRRLRTELSTQPGPALQRLYRAILDHAPALTSPDWSGR